MNNKEVAQKVVDRICELIKENGTLPWVKPWSRHANTVEIIDGYKTVTLAPVAWNRRGVQYSGANIYLPVGEYITWAQCKSEGGSVKKGAKGFPVVYWNFFKKTVHNDETGEDEVKVIPFLKYYTVFRVEDCDGLKPKHSPKPRTYTVAVTHTETVDGNDSTNATAEAVIADYVSRAGNGFCVKREAVTNEAFYSPALDYVSVPKREQFKNESEFYSTMFHELGHSTGHKTRLNRFSGENKIASWGDENYAKEELVAESTAASLLNSLGMEDGNTFRNSAAYIKSWSEAIKKDPLMYVSAAQKAQAAVDLILGVEDSKDEAADEAAE